jgi:predicted DNA-binding transcriptional regulator AlpA
MDELLNGKSIKSDFEAQVTAALMVQSNALIPLKLAARLCGLPKHEIVRRINCGTFPKPRTLCSKGKSIREAFYLKDLHEWIKCPHLYHQRGLHE